MPGFNGTGPLGRGPLTGRGSGYCMGYVAPGSPRGLRHSGGGGRGRRHCYYETGLPGRARTSRAAAVSGALYAPPAAGEDELAMLQEQASHLESALEQAKKRIGELEKKISI